MASPAIYRRSLLLGSAAVLATSMVRAQTAPRVLGAIMSGSERDADTQRALEALRLGLAEQGWREPESILIECRFDAVDRPSAAAAAAELLSLQPDAFLANTNIVTEEVLKVTRSIPVVFMPVGDPIDAGFVESYSRPGGNATGFTDFEPSHAGKWLGFLREVAPEIRRAVLLHNPDSAPRNGWFYLSDFSANAYLLGIEPVSMRIGDAAEIEPVMTLQESIGRTGIVVGPDAFTMVNRAPILDAIQRHRLPAIYPYANYTDEGGLISYSIDMEDIFRRGGVYIGRILNGEQPAELPVQAPERFQLVVNLQAARELGVAIPLTILAIADRIIE